MKRLEALLETITHLRSDEGCPWDRKQTHHSLIPYLREEAAEVIDAIEEEASDALADELGDLLLQILLHSEIAAEDQKFTFLEVADRLNQKLIRRHPHLFAGKVYANEVEQKADWERIKAAERQAKAKESGVKLSDHLLDRIPHALSGLMRADKLQKAAAKVGFDWDEIQAVYAKVEEELAELVVEIEADDYEKMEEELGDLLFAMVNLARHLGIDPENAIAKSNKKFYRRFNYIESAISAMGDQLSEQDLETLDYWWNQAKKWDYRSISDV